MVYKDDKKNFKLFWFYPKVEVTFSLWYTTAVFKLLIEESFTNLCYVESIRL